MELGQWSGASRTGLCLEGPGATSSIDHKLFSSATVALGMFLSYWLAKDDREMVWTNTWAA
jgi:hypothetical protein